MARSAIPILLLLAAHAAADDIYPTRGNRPLASNVKVIDESGGKVVYLDLSLKERSFPASIVGRIARKQSDVHVYLERYEAARTADAVMELAAWAAETKFKEEVIEALHARALELDPMHEGANLALGRVQHKGEWMTPEEREARLRAEEEEAMRAKGLVRWQDQWVTPEDKEKLDAGLRKYKGRWMTEEEIKEAEGYVKHEGRWVKKDELEVIRLTGWARQATGLGDRLQLVQSEHYAVMGDLPPDQLNNLSATMERLWSEWLRVFPDSQGSDILEGKHRLFAFRKAPPYQRYVRARYEKEKAEGVWSERNAKLEEQRMKLRLRETSCWFIQPVPESAHVQMPDPFEGMRSHCVHFGANILATRYARTRFPTWWINEGIAYYFEKRVTGAIQTYNADTGGIGGYADQGPQEAQKANPWLDGNRWNDLLAGLVRTGRDPKLDRIRSKNLWEAKNRLTAPDLAKAHSVVTFLILDDARKFAEFYRDIKEGSGSEIEREVNAVLKHYGSYDKIEERWKQFALNGFRLAR